MNKLYLSALLIFPLLMSCTTESDDGDGSIRGYAVPHEQIAHEPADFQR